MSNEELIAEAREWAKYDTTGASVIVRALADALKSLSVPAEVPPVTREALIEAVASRLSWPSMHWNFGDPDMHRAVVDSIMPLLSVSPPAEVEWEYQCDFPGLGWGHCPDREKCVYPVRKRMVHAAGPWVLVVAALGGDE